MLIGFESCCVVRVTAFVSRDENVGTNKPTAAKIHTHAAQTNEALINNDSHTANKSPTSNSNIHTKLQVQQVLQ